MTHKADNSSLLAVRSRGDQTFRTTRVEKENLANVSVAQLQQVAFRTCVSRAGRGRVAAELRRATVLQSSFRDQHAFGTTRLMKRRASIVQNALESPEGLAQSSGCRLVAIPLELTKQYCNLLFYQQIAHDTPYAMLNLFAGFEHAPHIGSTHAPLPT